MEVIGRADIREAGEWAEIPPFWEPSIAGVEVEGYATERLYAAEAVDVLQVRDEVGRVRKEQQPEDRTAPKGRGRGARSGPVVDDQCQYERDPGQE